MMKEVFIKHLVIPIFGLIVLGIPIACTYFWSSFVSKSDFDNVEIEKDNYINYAHKFDSLLSVSERDREELKEVVKNQRELLLEYIEQDKKLTKDAIFVIEDSTFSHSEFDSILSDLRNAVN